MHHYKAIVSDIDGTLNNSSHQLSNENKEAIHQFIRSGYTFVLASGRPTSGMTGIVDELDLKQYGGYLLSFQGGQLVDIISGEVVYERGLSISELETIIAFAQEHDVAFCSYSDDEIVTNRDNEQARVEASLTGMSIRIEPDMLTYFKNKNIPKVIILGDEKRIEELEPLMKQQVGDILQVAISMPIFLEVTPKGVHKGTGIEELSKVINIAVEDIIGVGDGGNDLELIQTAGLGLAVSNATQVLKDVADEIIVSNDEHVIKYIVDTYFDL